VREPTAPADRNRLARFALDAGGRHHQLNADARRAADDPDMIGFALIFAAAACVLTQPAQRTVAQAP
jgi:hypothetical protein